MSNRKSAQIAIGGVFSALCLLLMFLTAAVPFSTFALPLMAGATLIVVMIENGGKTAFLVYVSVSLLSLLIVQDLEAKLLFILFFGYYSILKPILEKIPGKLKQIGLKLLIFNVSMLLGYWLSLHVSGLSEAESDFLGKYAPAIYLLGVNFTFFCYDFLLKRYTLVYIYWFKPTFLRR